MFEGAVTYSVYIIRSESTVRYYCGHTSDVERRIGHCGVGAGALFLRTRWNRSQFLSWSCMARATA